MEKTYTFVSFGRKHEVVLRKTKYRNNGTLAVFMVEIMPDGFEEEYGVLTVNLEESDFFCLSGDRQFIDTNNFSSDVIDWLVDNGLGKKGKHIGHSGFCEYPLFIFNEEALNDMRSM